MATTSQRLLDRAGLLIGNDPNYLFGYPIRFEQQQIFDSHNKWRFIIEHVYKVPANDFDQFRAFYVKYRHVILECKKYMTSMIKGRTHFYNKIGQTMSPNLEKLMAKKLFYF
jgi:hypothetical protein